MLSIARVEMLCLATLCTLLQLKTISIEQAVVGQRTRPSVSLSRPERLYDSLFFITEFGPLPARHHAHHQDTKHETLRISCDFPVSNRFATNAISLDASQQTVYGCTRMKRAFLNARIPESLATDFRIAAMREGVTLQALLTRAVSRFLRDQATLRSPRAGAKAKCDLCGTDHRDDWENLPPRRRGRPRKKPIPPQVASVARIKAGALRLTNDQLRQAIADARAAEAEQLAAERK
ncbi:MAG: hypothetical protein ACLQU2_03380 [Candidatus Binataceae bacterium]